MVEVLKRMGDNVYPRGSRRVPASYYLMKKLREKNLIEYKKQEVNGKNVMSYTVSGRGRSYVALSKSWFPKETD